MHETNESLRKFLHIAIGFGALLLKPDLLPWLNWRIAVAICVVAAFGNWLLLHRIVGKRVARHERGWDAGIVLYPLVVGALIAIFNWHIELAAVGWAILAFGDGFATILGRAMPVAPLPWNRAKSFGGCIAFIIFGAAASFGVAYWFGEMDELAIPIAIAVVSAAIVESLPLGINDNISVPLAAATALGVFGIEPLALAQAHHIAWFWIALNTLLAIAGYFLKGVDISGATFGWILGTIIILGGGAGIYVALIAFFIIGTLCTKLGYARKAAAGLAQEKEGRRGAAHAFANAGVAAICAVACWRGLGLVPLFMGIAALATATADTCASEIGQLIGRTTFLPLSFRRVERGTEGAISIEGTLAGIFGALIVAIAATAMTIRGLRPGFTVVVTIDRLHTIGVLTAVAFVGSYLESIAGSWNRRHGSPIPNGVLNFFNTAAGAMLFWIATLFVPMFGFELR
jgi:uncharacterized protein (TIGR00297 family)